MAAILPTMIIVNSIPQVLADPAHCDQSGWPNCYAIGYADGHQDGYVGAHNGMPYPYVAGMCHGHSNNWCSGFIKGYNDGYYGFARQPGPVAYALSPSQSGYKHGVSDAKLAQQGLGGSDWYITQPGKGFAFHTQEFNSGYVNGFCSIASSGAGSDANQATFRCN